MFASTVAIQSKQGNQQISGVPASNHNLVKIGPSILDEYYEIDGQLYKKVALFRLFSFRNRPTRQEIPPSQSSESSFIPCTKETENFLIKCHLLNTKSLYLEFYHKQQHTLMIHLAIANEHLSDLAKNKFNNVAGLFQKLKDSEMMLQVSPSGQLVACFKAVRQQANMATKQKRQKTDYQERLKLYKLKVRATIQATKEKQRKSVEQLRLLLAVQQEQRHSGKESLRNIQTLIQKSRCLPQGNEEVLRVMQLWNRRLQQALAGNQIEQLHLALIICEKYWLRNDLWAQDELMNVMRRKMGRLIECGEWLLE